MPKLTDVMPDRIRSIRKQKNMGQQELAERAGTTTATISKIERSTRGLTLDWVERLARALEITVEDLMFDSAAKSSIRSVPIVGRIAAGNWREAVLDPVGHVSSLSAGPEGFALRPDGDSMNLVLPADAVVIIDPHSVELRDGLIYAVMNGGGETTLKRFRADPARLEPCSSNPIHKPIMLGQQPFTVLGRAVEAVTAL